MTVTQKFIAEKAGVSQKTVSIYLKDSERIAAKTREKLKQVMTQYGYFPNTAARSIKSKQFNRIACVILQHNSIDRVTHPHTFAYINGAASELAKENYSLVLEPFDINLLNQEFLNSPNFFSTLSVDGILGIAGTFVPPIVDKVIKNMALPVVWLNRFECPDKIPSLVFNENVGAAELVKHVMSLGIKNIAWFGPVLEGHPYVHYSSRERCNAVKHFIQDRDQVSASYYFSELGQKLTLTGLKIFDTSPLPEAIICYNFDYAETVKNIAATKGIKVPGDLQIFHFASAWEVNTEIYDLQTCVLLPEVEMGRRGATFLLNKLKGIENSKLLQPLTGKLHIGKSIYDDK